MESLIKKYQQKFKKAKDEMSKWDDLQSSLISHFRNASSIISRLQIIQNPKNYASLASVGGIEVAVTQKQIDSLQTILLSMKTTMEDFRGVVTSLEKLQYDGKQLAKGSSNQLNKKQLQHRIGVKPTLTNCIDGLVLLHEMYLAEYLLKSSLVSALSSFALKPKCNFVTVPKHLGDEGGAWWSHSHCVVPIINDRTLKESNRICSSDLGALHQLLVDQPNILNEEVQYMFDMIFAEEIC